jgi:hypothetical protein
MFLEGGIRGQGQEGEVCGCSLKEDKENRVKRVKLGDELSCHYLA